MAEVMKIAVMPRDKAKNKGTGTRVSRKLRSQGRIPAIIYGHKIDPQPISISKLDALEMLKRSVHLAELSIGDASETVLVRDIQWDHLGAEILHLDFARVNVEESIETEVRIDLRGVAPGIAEGGVLEHLMHSISVTCRADAIPDSIRVDVSALHLGGAVHVRDLMVPEGITLNEDGEALVAHVITRSAEPAPAEAAPIEGAAEPELIRARPEDKEKDKDKDKS